MNWHWLALALVACRSVDDHARTVAPTAAPSARAEEKEAGPTPAPASLEVGADLDAGPCPSGCRDAIGPFQPNASDGRPVWFTLPVRNDEARLIAHLHGQCAPPVYSCGQWLDAGAARGFVVCPTGNEHCTSPIGPAMWDESFALMDQDLERAIAVAAKKTDGGFSREGAVLTGFSRGGWAAIELVRMHPGRWPYLVLIEADVTATLAHLQASKVRALAMIAGEWGTELPGERKTVDALVAQGYPAKLFVMPKTAHLYSANIDSIMADALDFVLSHGPDAGTP